MKKTYLLIFAILIFACSKEFKIDTLETGYVDYSNYPIEKQTPIDRLLAKNISFKDGILTPKIDLNSAIAQGVSKEKYDYFLEYIDIENKRIKQYLDRGAVVFYNGEAFTTNPESEKFIDTTSSQNTKAGGYTQIRDVYRETFYYSQYINRFQCNFTAGSRISLVLSGSGSIEMHESSKRFDVYLASSSGESRSATIKWGFDDYVNWKWTAKYYGSPSYGSSATLIVKGYSKYVDSRPDDNNSYFFTKDLPNYVTTDFGYVVNGKPGMDITIKSNEGDRYKVQLYEHHRNSDQGRKIFLHSEIAEVSANMKYRLTYPRDSSYLLVVHKIEKSYYTNNITHQYIGDRFFVGNHCWSPY